jgi:hypothetical protein
MPQITSAGRRKSSSSNVSRSRAKPIGLPARSNGRPSRRRRQGPNRGSYGRGHGWLVSERTAFRIAVSQARIPTWMGPPSRNRSLLSSEKGVTYASTPRRKAKTAAS